jgi:uncharacterized protein
MSGETDLRRLLAAMSPVVREGQYVFVSLAGQPDLPCEATIREDEGVTCVVRREVADEQAWGYEFVAAWITLQVHSALAAVGLTAAVSAALADAGIGCNVLAGSYHDHLLVPAERLHDALRALADLSSRA